MLKWISPSCEFHPEISEDELIRKIEFAYRVCYNTTHKMQHESKEDALRFVMDKIGLGHGSPLEHVSFTFIFITSRSIANEIVRHRLASYSQESMRYCKYENELHCILPSICMPGGDMEHESETFKQGVEQSYNLYCKLRKDNMAPQFARDVLPLCTATKIVCTWNFREILHILDLRYFSQGAHPDLRQLMDLMYKELQVHYPNVFHRPRVF